MLDRTIASDPRPAAPQSRAIYRIRDGHRREYDASRDRGSTSFRERCRGALADIGIYGAVSYRDLAEAHFGGHPYTTHATLEDQRGADRCPSRLGRPARRITPRVSRAVLATDPLGLWRSHRPAPGVGTDGRSSRHLRCRASRRTRRPGAARRSRLYKKDRKSLWLKAHLLGVSVLCPQSCPIIAPASSARHQRPLRSSIAEPSSRPRGCQLAFEFLVLTATRSGEVRGALWAEIDQDEGAWIIPAPRTKGNREHRSPLCRRALEILEEVRALGRGSPLVFPGLHGKPVASTALSELLRELEIAAVPYGFRSSFRDWAAEETDHPREVVEAALAHRVRNQVEAAYMRSDLFERRRRVMNDWAAYLAGEHRDPDAGPIR